MLVVTVFIGGVDLMHLFICGLKDSKVELQARNACIYLRWRSEKWLWMKQPLDKLFISRYV